MTFVACVTSHPVYYGKVGYNQISTVPEMSGEMTQWENESDSHYTDV